MSDDKTYMRVGNENIEIEKGGSGSGIKGHKTAAEAGPGHVWRDKKSGLHYAHHDYLEHNRQGLMNYSGFDDKPGAFMSHKQVAHAVSQHTGHSPDTAHEIVQHLKNEGHIQQHGHVIHVMKPGAGVKKLKKSDPLNPEPMYKAEERPYEGQDINDMIEADFQKAQDKKKKVMGEFHEGTLHSGSKKGPKVTDPKQAVAIAYSEAGESKKKAYGADGGGDSAE